MVNLAKNRADLWSAYLLRDVGVGHARKGGAAPIPRHFVDTEGTPFVGDGESRIGVEAAPSRR